MQQNPERLGREQPMEMTANVKGNYPNYKQKIAKENFVISEVTRSQLFGKYRLRAATYPKRTTSA